MEQHHWYDTAESQHTVKFASCIAVQCHTYGGSTQLMNYQLNYTYNKDTTLKFLSEVWIEWCGKSVQVVWKFNKQINWIKWTYQF